MVDIEFNDIFGNGIPVSVLSNNFTACTFSNNFNKCIVYRIDILNSDKK